jgi:hypothetical protein
VALRGALVDQGRSVSRVPVSPRVEGQTQIGLVYGEWFRARLFLEQAPEAPDAGGHLRAVSSPQFLMDIVDLQGNPVSVNADEHVEINSPELGRATWQVIDDPQPIRKKRRVIGYYGALRQVQERQAVL